MSRYEMLGFALEAGSWADWFAGTMSFIAVATALGGYWFAMWSKQQDATERDIQASEALGWKIIQTLNLNEHIHDHIEEGFAAALNHDLHWKFATVRPLALSAHQISDLSSGEVSSMIRAKAIDQALDLSECILRLESIRNSMHEYKTRHEALFELLPPPVQGDGTVFSHYLDKNEQARALPYMKMLETLLGDIHKLTTINRAKLFDLRRTFPTAMERHFGKWTIKLYTDDDAADGK